MALVPHRSRDFQVAPPVWVGAVSNRPAGRPTTGSRSNAKQRKGGVSVRRLMLECAQRQWLHTALSVTPTSSGQVTPLNDLNQGTTVSSRLGNQVRFLELEYAGCSNTLCTAGYDEIRLVIFVDRQPESLLPTPAELLCVVSPRSCFNPDLVGNQDQPRFKILANHYLTVNNPGPFTATQGYASQPVSGRIRLDFTSTYVGNAGTYADLQTNGLYCLTVAASSATGINLDFCLKFVRM
jgi:hypothetical protein